MMRKNCKVHLKKNVEPNSEYFYIHDLERAIVSTGYVSLVSPVFNIGFKRLLVRLYRYLFYPRFHMCPRILKTSDNEYTLAITCGADVAYAIFPLRRNKRTILYVYDAWEAGIKYLAWWHKLFEFKKIYFSSKLSADKFNKITGTCIGCWVPEGINPNRYIDGGYIQKSIDVLEYGRVYDKFHDRITPALIKNAFSHKYGYVNDLSSALAASKISICFPSSITHPTRSGSLETMTLRYLEAMISKCLIVGKAPDEMIILFGYNPVVEIDVEYADVQIIEILKNISHYDQLIQLNYKNVIAHHTYDCRANDIMQQSGFANLGT